MRKTSPGPADPGQRSERSDLRENGTTWTYAYDRGGNILSKKRYAYTVSALPETALETVTYAYTDDNWKDKLTEFNGSYITYDEIGNPTSDGEWLYAWEKGRQLKAMSKASETVVFEYNADGLRVKKIATSTGTTHYTLHGKQITHLTNGSNTLHFFYDAAGKPAMVEWNNGTTTAKYAYIHCLQGDIVGIIDSTGTKVVSYTYDAWGKPLSTTGPLATTLGKLNPFRYRGYVYDEETGLYYLRSRYYNATRCRFINADIFVTTGNELLSTNNYTYCKNKIINHIDENGQADRTISQEDDYLTKALSYLLLNIESRTENSTSQKILEIPGIITFTHKETIGWTSNSDGKGVYPVIGISNEGVINGYSIYGENVFSGITHGDNNLSVELGADNVSLGITLGLGWSWFGPTLDISLDYTVYDGKGQYVRTTYTASVGILGALLIAAAIIAAPGLATVLPATAPALLAFAT